MINWLFPALTNSSSFPLVNDTEAGPVQTVDISNPDTTKWTIRELEPVSRYLLYLRSCTTVGCGPIASVECTTTLETRESWSVQRWWRYACGWFNSGYRQWQHRQEH